MIQICNIHCRTLDEDKIESLNIKDKGKWLPFSFLLDIVVAVKMASDEEDELAFETTTIFTDQGDAYVIDTPYYEFQAIWVKYINSLLPPPPAKESKLSF